MLYLIYIFILASAILIGLSLYPHSQRKPLPVLNLTESVMSRPIKRPVFFKLLGFLVPLNKPIVNILGRKNIETKVLSANIGLLAEDFIALKEFLLALSALLFRFLFKDLFRGNELIILVICILASLLGPDIWLKMHIRKRQRMILRALPDAVDLLSLCVNAGLDFSVAVKWVVDKSEPNPLVEELGLLLMETRVGKPRRQALQDMAKRVDLPEVYSFSRALIQAERLGTPVESALNLLSEEVRDTRFRRGERLALQAPIKMLFPLIFFIMPVVGIIVGGPVLLQFLQGGIAIIK